MSDTKHDGTNEGALWGARFASGPAPELAALSGTVERLLRDTGIEAGRIDHVFLTGGTSFVPAVRRLFEALFGAGKVRGGGEFVSVAEGLALIGRDRGPPGAEPPR